ncbi:unnamed protein product, partial [Brenthis ino]
MRLRLVCGSCRAVCVQSTMAAPRAAGAAGVGGSAAGALESVLRTRLAHFVVTLLTVPEVEGSEAAVCLIASRGEGCTRRQQELNVCQSDAAPSTEQRSRTPSCSLMSSCAWAADSRQQAAEAGGKHGNLAALSVAALFMYYIHDSSVVIHRHDTYSSDISTSSLLFAFCIQNIMLT